MLVTFDLDGVLYEKPECWVPIVKLLKSAGAKVGVLTGHKQESEIHDFERLRRLGYPEFDLYCGRREHEMGQNGALRKSSAIAAHGVIVHFDDYDYDHPDTERLFGELGQEHKIVHIKSAGHGAQKRG